MATGAAPPAAARHPGTAIPGMEPGPGARADLMPGMALVTAGGF
jgi:hypothetical protein